MNAARAAERQIGRPEAQILPAAEPGMLSESARVRQAAEVMRQWQARSAGGEGGQPEAIRHAPASGVASAISVSTPVPQTTAGVTGAEAGAMSLADSQAAAEQLVQRVLQGQARNASNIRIQLSPAELGHLQIQLTHQGDRLEVAFTASHPVARDLIEANLPNLRSLLQDAGFNLADVDVRHEAPGRDASRGGQAAAQQDDGQSESAEDAGTGDDRGESAAAAAATETGAADDAGDADRRPGGIDAFA